MIALIIVMFVGGHSLSRVDISLSGDSAIADIAHSSPVAERGIVTLAGERVIVAGGVENLEIAVADGNHVSGEDLSGSSHCAAHCGIDVVLFVDSHPAANWSRDVLLATANLAETANEHFRPPII